MIKGKRLSIFMVILMAFSLFSFSGIHAAETSSESKQPLRQMEKLNRALVAVETDEGIYVGWKMLGTDSESVTFDLFRDGEKVNDEPISTSTNYLDEDGTSESTYQVRVNNGSGDALTEEVDVWSEQYLGIPLDKPEGGETPDGETYTYSANDVSVGDVTGDGDYELIVKWDPSNSKDNSHAGYTGNVYIDAYTLEGDKLWRIDRKSTRLNSSHVAISYAVFCLKKKIKTTKVQIAMKIRQLA